jgi:ribonuclease-3
LPSNDGIEALEVRLGVSFRDRSRLQQALRHRSVTSDSTAESNERLEFLGDSIIGMVICDSLFHSLPSASEGEMAKAKAYLVSESVLADVARQLGLDQAIEIATMEGGRQRKSILSDAYEAVVAAVFLDQGFSAAQVFIQRTMSSAMQRISEDRSLDDYKSLLQVHMQATSRITPRYRIVQETGADHDKTFMAEALLDMAVIGTGVGKSKKQAEQEAARDALIRLSILEDDPTKEDA